MSQKIVLSLKEIKPAYTQAKLERLQKGYPLKFKRTRPREKFKKGELVKFLLNITPPAENILSGRAFSKLFTKNEHL